MKKIRWIIMGIVMTGLLASCGGDDKGGENQEASSFFSFVESLAASKQDTSEPIDVEAQITSQSETAEPVEVN